jgi:hypothetical protein
VLFFPPSANFSQPCHRLVSSSILPDDKDETQVEVLKQKFAVGAKKHEHVKPFHAFIQTIAT